MPTFSANLGFLWQELSLPDAIRAAKAAGFDAVECHYPYDTPPEAVRRALEETGLPMLGLNTARGNVTAGENGLAAIPGREGEARRLIDQAIDYAAAIGARNVHVMAGKATGDEARAAFLGNLRYACERADRVGATVLIEPLNHRDAPDYFLRTADQALDIITAVGADNLKLMFDCYHIQIMQGDLTHRLREHLGEIDYRHILRFLGILGYDKPIGAEYRPATTTDAGLTWLQAYR